MTVAEPLVAPLAGAWIEMRVEARFFTDETVAPLAGAWIEMFLVGRIGGIAIGRTPRGCVD